MQFHLITVGNKPKKWEKSAFDEYKNRLPGNWKLTTDVINPVKRSKNSLRQAIDEEGRKIISKISRNEQIILLDESGENLSTKEFYLKMTSLAEINNKLLKRKNIRIIFLLDSSLIKAAKRRVKYI